MHPAADHRRTLILAASVVTLVCVTLGSVMVIVYFSLHPGAGAAAGVNPLVLMGGATGFGLVSINQLLAMLRGHLADVAATSARERLSNEIAETKATAQRVDGRLNGDLDRRITEAVGRAVESKMEAMCDGVEDVRKEVHTIKHDVKDLRTEYEAIEALLRSRPGE